MQRVKRRRFKAVNKTKPDLIICSGEQSKFDIITFFRSVKSAPQTRRIPFLFTTSPDVRLHEEVEKLNPKHLLVKPYTRERLAIAVQNSLKN
jgi:two-component SAPR family response regulator